MSKNNHSVIYILHQLKKYIGSNFLKSNDSSIKNNAIHKYSILSAENNVDIEKFNLFFNNEIKKNIRSTFNYFNYIVRCNKSLNEIEVLNKYFKSKNLSLVQKKEVLLPLYIDNIKRSHKNLKTNIFEKKVTVIMTVYNQERLIINALVSLFDQTYKNINIIVIDDASNDGTLEKLIEAKKVYSDRLIIITNKYNLGTYTSKNIGITYSSGDFITFHDADDWAHPQRIENHVKMHLENKNMKFSISKLARITEDGYFFSKHIFPLDRLSMISLMIDKSLIDEVGYFRKQRIGSDSEYFERLKKFTKHKFERIDKVLMFCAHRENSLTTSAETGVEGFGENSKRQHHWDRWNNWHAKLKKARRKPFVGFDRSKYEYEILA